MTKEPPPPTPPLVGPPLERIVTMKPAPLRPGVEQQHQPIVPKARWRVTCNDCGAAFDSAAATAEAAIMGVAASHEPRHEHLSVAAADYSAHPLYAR